MKAKKHLGQHFLTDTQKAIEICESLTLAQQDEQLMVVEVGPGKGVLTQHLVNLFEGRLWLVELDPDMVQILEKEYPQVKHRIIEQDVLQADLTAIGNHISLIGNFPYYISTQIVFMVLEERERVEEMVGMFQREVAQRIASPPGNKDYGILSVLCQAFYNVKYLFTVPEGAFSPPPKVKSGVLSMQRKQNFYLPCDERLFFAVVKAGFSQRRKTLRNALSNYKPKFTEETEPLLTKRAEQLGYKDFIYLTQQFQEG